VEIEMAVQRDGFGHDGADEIPGITAAAPPIFTF
jgi:hypothetical protein